MRELGYDNINAFLNLSTISILLILYTVRVSIYFAYKAYQKIKEKAADRSQNEGG